MAFFTDEQRRIISMMYHERSDEYNALLESFGLFIEREILPTAAIVDKKSIFPKDNIDKIFRNGFTNISFPEDVGGLGLPFPVYLACMELVAKACASTAISLAIHGTVCDGIFRFGNKAQHEKYLRPLILGQKLAAFGLTEASGGSDAKSLTTRATLTDGEWNLNGEKMFITNSGEADYYFVFARTDKGFASLIIPKEAKGLSVGKNIQKMGLRGSSLAELTFRELNVPEENIIGTDGEGFEYAKKMLLGGRITVAAISVGIAQIALEKSISYAKGRTAFGNKLSDFQMTRSKVAEMQTEIHAARLMTYYAGYLKAIGEDYTSQACQAKLYASEMALRVCNECIQIHGGYGYTDEADVHRHWRDAKLMTIGEGTSEIMKLIISNQLFKS
ncbi:MAG TPA: acyl-CoA dehydrogenase family protein [Nitrososphaerales archaeon]|nr:acyl-CoA dehydrogenase family protein [Nitrososphaerales archaeon]